MISAVTTALPIQPTTTDAAQAKPTAQKPAQSQAANTPADTVQISNAAQVALKETLETSAQTAKEAAGGDHQAQRLLAKEAAQKAV
jgi:hypothetical protein